jgi:hypothetical protein
MNSTYSASSNLLIKTNEGAYYPDNPTTGFKVGSSDLSNIFDINLNRTGYSNYFKVNGYNSNGVYPGYLYGTVEGSMTSTSSYKYHTSSANLYGLKLGSVYKRVLTMTQKTAGVDASLDFTPNSLKGSGGYIYLVLYSGGGNGGAGYVNVNGVVTGYGPAPDYTPIIGYYEYTAIGGGGGASGGFWCGPVRVEGTHTYSIGLLGDGTVYLYNLSTGTFLSNLGPGSSAVGNTKGSSIGYYSTSGGNGGSNSDRGSDGENNEYRNTINSLYPSLYYDPSFNSAGNLSYRGRVGWINLRYSGEYTVYSYYSTDANSIYGDTWRGGIGGTGAYSGTYGRRSTAGGGGGGASFLGSGGNGANGSNPTQNDGVRAPAAAGGGGGGCRNSDSVVGSGGKGGKPFVFLYY